MLSSRGQALSAPKWWGTWSGVPSRGERQGLPGQARAGEGGEARHDRPCAGDQDPEVDVKCIHVKCGFPNHGLSWTDFLPSFSGFFFSTSSQEERRAVSLNQSGPVWGGGCGEGGCGGGGGCVGGGKNLAGHFLPGLLEKYTISRVLSVPVFYKLQL